MRRRKFLKGLSSAAVVGAASSSKGASFLGSSSLETKASVSQVAALIGKPDDRIKHIIVLMLENRSFDHMLGYSRIDGVDGVWDKDCSNLDENGTKVSTSPNAQTAGDLMVDPGHDFTDVQIQLFSPNDKNQMPGTDPQMNGFIRSYARYKDAKSHNIMKCFSPESVPVLTRLAREFVVCNRWFSSIPGPTLPNRLFAHAGTSQGRLDMSAAEFNISPTIYEVLSHANVSSTIYADGWTATSTFWNLMKYQDQYFGTLDDFYQDCYDNQLPGYCFIEPRYSSGIVDGTFRPQNDQHPNSDVAEGEQLIHDVYKAIRGNRKVWESSIFVVVYDEHGGIYDHVPPPKAVPPGDPSTPDFGFGFDRYGVRVPAVIVSAYTDHAVLNDVFDHTSLIATARKLLTGQYQDAALHNRAMQAIPFDKALNRDRDQGPRKDHVELPAPQVRRGKHDQQSLEADLNHLQIMNLKQALLVNGSLPASLQINPKSVLKKDVTNSSADEEFKGIQVKNAEHYIQSIQTSARDAKTLIPKDGQPQTGAPK
ncbi:MAG TPA: alkaline phosphatase family protein [Candidatus Angelobacter sp.]|nr:alkaline phosphatase family protein [Candidatus Angelobacter sp.]